LTTQFDASLKAAFLRGAILTTGIIALPDELSILSVPQAHAFWSENLRARWKVDDNGWKDASYVLQA